MRNAYERRGGAVLTGVQRSARLSACGTYRWTLTRSWDRELPVLLVVMFNPSDADHDVDDPTITLTCQIAAHNGYGGIVVVNLIPLRSPQPAAAAEMTRWDQHGPDWHARDRLQDNLAVIQQEAGRAGAVLVACGALADRCADWFHQVLEEIECGLPDGTKVLCLGESAGGYPKHPLARGKHKVPKNAKLRPWREASP